MSILFISLWFNQSGGSPSRLQMLLSSLKSSPKLLWDFPLLQPLK
jgi:hypothetical protein